MTGREMFGNWRMLLNRAVAMETGDELHVDFLWNGKKPRRGGWSDANGSHSLPSEGVDMESMWQHEKSLIQSALEQSNACRRERLTC